MERWNGGTSDRVILSKATDLLFPGLRFAFFRGIRAFSRSIGFQQDSARQLELLMTRKRARMRENSPMIPSGPKAPLHEPLAFHRSTVPPFYSFAMTPFTNRLNVAAAREVAANTSA